MSGCLVDLARTRVFYDGTLTDPQLDHPEGIAIHPDGSVWCGGERGQIFRIARDGSSMDQVASTGGFCLGLAFAGDRLYVCDMKHRAVFALDTRTGRLERFAEGAGGVRMRVPNAIAVLPGGDLFVSDSHGMKEPGPGIFRFQPDGSGELWYDADVDFANGVALSPDSRFLYVAATFGSAVFRIPIGEDGSPGGREEVVHLPGVLPDGLALDTAGRLYIACYEPSKVLRVAPDGTVRCLVADPEAHQLCHPTNVALRGGEMFISNLGRWHVAALQLPEE